MNFIISLLPNIYKTFIPIKMYEVIIVAYHEFLIFGIPSDIICDVFPLFCDCDLFYFISYS